MYVAIPSKGKRLQCSISGSFSFIGIFLPIQYLACKHAAFGVARAEAYGGTLYDACKNAAAKHGSCTDAKQTGPDATGQGTKHTNSNCYRNSCHFNFPLRILQFFVAARSTVVLAVSLAATHRDRRATPKAFRVVSDIHSTHCS